MNTYCSCNLLLKFKDKSKEDLIFKSVFRCLDADMIYKKIVLFLDARDHDITEFDTIDYTIENKDLNIGYSLLCKMKDEWFTTDISKFMIVHFHNGYTVTYISREDFDDNFEEDKENIKNVLTFKGLLLKDITSFFIRGETHA